MKKYLLSLILLASSLFAVAQGTITWGFGSGIIDSCSFQSGNCSLISFDTAAQNIWQQGLSNKPFFGNTNGVFTDSINVYPKNNRSYFEIKIPYNGDYGTVLSFTHKFDTDTLIDGGYIEYYNAYDTMWENVLSPNLHYRPEHFNFSNMHNDSLINGEHGFSGKTNNWITTQIEWIWYLPVRLHKSAFDSLRIRFHFVSDSVQTNKAGWIIKNFTVYWVFCSGINDIKNQNEISISPNPTTTSFLIQKTTPEKLNFQLYNLIGQNLVNTVLKENQTTVERNGLPSGAYLYSIRNQQGKMVQSGKVVFE